MHEKETIIDKIGRLISIAGNAILMNLLFLAACIPVFTIGQAWSGLLSAVRYNIRGEKWFDGFKAGFKRRFLRGTVSWCVMLVVDVYFLLDVIYNHHFYTQGGETAGAYMVPMIAAFVMFGLVIMVTISLQLLNLYVPTGVGEWLRNAVNMVFKVPLELLVAAALFWAPVVMLFLWPGIFYYLIMIFVTAYFAMIAAGITMLMKNALIHYLVEARTAGTLLAEEGRLGEKETQEEK